MQALYLNFLQPHYKYEEISQSPISKSTPTFSVCPFFEEYLNLQVRIIKLVNKHTVDYLLSPSQD